MSEMVRLNKFLSQAGVCSRRRADELIEEGHVTIDGRTAATGEKVSGSEDIRVDGVAVSKEEETVVLMVNKPRGIVCTAEKREKNNIVDFVGYPSRVYPVGRLDKESRGLILMTNDGELVNALLRARYHHEKQYMVTVDHEITEDFIKKMEQGVFLEELGVKTRRCRVWKNAKNRFSIILTQGLNRQIRRMCQACGYRVRDLVRVRIQDLKLEDLKEGEYRLLTEAERKKLYDSVAKGMEQERVAGGGKCYEAGK
ncbi:MAG: pseudouridine synthase [Lachnospiraceae bacterium]|nr:pseudouridine synthase [Lachnospiraceae bacterium]